FTLDRPSPACYRLPSPSRAPRPAGFPVLTLEEYVRLPELKPEDIAAYHLACAVGLPGSDKIDFDRCFRTLKDMTAKVRAETERLWPFFRKKPKKYRNSEPYFRTLLMITVLQRDMGVRYNPDKISPAATFYLEDSFIHGILQGKGGTCASLPVLYAAVG